MDEDQEFERILLDHGFVLVRTRGSHKQFKGVADGVTRLATLDYSQPGEDILPRNLRSMIHQSGLSEQLFRKR